MRSRQGQAERREGDRECLGVLEMGVEFLARTPGCQGKRHMCECVSGVRGRVRQLESQAGAGWDAEMQCSLLRGDH